MSALRKSKNPFSLPPSGFRSKAALAGFVERPQAGEWGMQLEPHPDQIGAYHAK
jgi:hypothetical protein